MTAAGAFVVIFLLVAVVGGLALVAAVRSEWPREREVDRARAEDAARRDRERD